MRNRIRAIGLILLALHLSALPAKAQNASKFRVDGERTKSYIEYLASDQFMGRQTLTPEFEQAAQWAADRFKEWGLKPAGENGTYFQDVPIARPVTWSTGIPALSVGDEAFSIHEGDFGVLSTSTAGARIQAQVVFVGYGISAPAKGLDEYAGQNVRGRVVLLLRGDPTAAPAMRRMSFGPDPDTSPVLEADLTREATDDAKIRTAFEKGASAVLIYNPDAATSGTGGFRRPQGGEEPFTPDRQFLAFTITDRVFHALMRADDQETNNGVDLRLGFMREDVRHGRSASVALAAPVSLSGYETVTVYSEANGNNIAHNVIAKIEGTDRRLRSQYVIMGGHLDHVGMRDGLVRNGADDNCSGAATTMEVARVLAEGGFRPRRTIIFCLWTGEELGLLGSQWFADHPTDGVTMDNTVTYFNMDMVGLGTRIGAPGALNFPEIYAVITRDQDPDVIAAVDPRTGGPGGSDHSAFIVRGIESLALMTSGGGGHPSYHQPEDDPAKIEPEILRKTGQFVLQGAMNLANERQVDLLIPDREDRYNALMARFDTFGPGMEQNAYRYVDISAKDRAGLVAVMLDSAMAIAQRPTNAAQTSMASMYARGGRGGGAGQKKSFNRGFRQVALFEGDVDLMIKASELIGFGRLDVLGDDGRWFAGGRLTPAGRGALQAMEANGIVLHLHSPAAGTLREVTASARQPFIVTGTYTLDSEVATTAKAKGAVFGMPLDPKDIKGTVAALQKAKATFGGVTNFCLTATAPELPDEAAQALYLGLLAEGWTPQEIAGDRRTGGGLGAALTTLQRAGMAGPRR